MTLFGKILVFVNLFVAVGLFAWAVALYSNRPDWTDRTDGELKVQGQINLMKAEIDRLSKAVRDTQGSYAAAAKRGAEQEAERDRRRAALNGWMAEVKDTNNPRAGFKTMVRLANGLIDCGRPGQGPPPPLAPYLGLAGQPLPGLGKLSTDLRELIRQERETKGNMELARQKLGGLINQTAVTEAEAVAQTGIRDGLQNQAAFLTDAQINWEETLRTLRLREEQLDRRLETVQPKGGGTATGGN